MGDVVYHVNYIEVHWLIRIAISKFILCRQKEKKRLFRGCLEKFDKHHYLCGIHRVKHFKFNKLSAF